MNELSAMTSTSREALVVFAENVDGVKNALEKLETGIEEQGKILETNNALIESINKLDSSFVSVNKLFTEEIANLSNNLTKSVNKSNTDNVKSLKKIIGELKATQIKTTKQLVSLSKKSSSADAIKKISSSQRKMNKSFNDLAKAVNNLANQSGELAKSFKKSSVIKYP